MFNPFSSFKQIIQQRNRKTTDSIHLFLVTACFYIFPPLLSFFGLIKTIEFIFKPIQFELVKSRRPLDGSKDTQIQILYCSRSATQTK